MSDIVTRKGQTANVTCLNGNKCDIKSQMPREIDVTKEKQGIVRTVPFYSL